MFVNAIVSAKGEEGNCLNGIGGVKGTLNAFHWKFFSIVVIISTSETDCNKQRIMYLI